MAATVIAAGSDNARVSDFWAQQFARNAVDGSIWMNNVLIRDHLYKLMSGGESKHWLLWVLENYLRDRPRIGRSLSICCGDGGHELLMYQTGKVGFVRGFDISAGALRHARHKFEGVGAPPDSYLFEELDANDLRLHDDRFDLVLSCGALHHITELEDLLDKVHGLLQPDGHFVVMEFVGPNRFQWTSRQCALINGLLAQLDPRYLRGAVRETFGPPTIEEMLRIDPSEAVRSEELLPLVRDRFRVDYEARFNGTLMHMLYPRLNTDLGNRGNPDFDTIVRLLLYFEEVLTAEGVVAPDFVLQVCRRKDCTEKRTAPPAPTRPASPSGPIGSVDTCSAAEVTGWAADPGRPNVSLFVEVRVNGRRVGKVFCGTHRPDVRAAGYGNGLCGFVYPFAPSDRPAPGSRVEVRVAGTKVRIGTATVAAA
jgi:SAM-dependent methyltransferase